MLMYGTSVNIIPEATIFNLCSYKEGYQNLNLIPPISLGKLINKDFDIAYMQYIMSNDMIFVNFFNIIYCLYSGYDVYIIIGNDDWTENLAESLMKLIQQRYGYNGVKINNFDDYLYFSNNSKLSDFAPGYGVANLDMDKERYSYLVEHFRLKNGGRIGGDVIGYE